MTSIAAILLSLAVVVSAICRLAGMTIKTHRAEWVMVYLLMLWGAGVTGLSALVRAPTPSEILLLAACGLYLWHSRHTWRPAPPKYMERS